MEAGVAVYFFFVASSDIAHHRESDSMSICVHVHALLHRALSGGIAGD